jgi:ATP-dependent DNA helicase RecG
MLTLAQLATWVAAGESDTQEFKRTTAELKSGMQTLSAFLNHRGGRLFFGVGDDGRVIGQSVSDATMRDIAQEIRRIDPPAQTEITRVPVGDANGGDVIVVRVDRGQSRPHTYNGRAYKRIGNTTSEMTRDEYNRMLLESTPADRRWEAQPAEGWTLDDLDASEITRTVDEAIRRGRMDEPGTRDTRELLRGLGLTLDDDQLTRAALVLFGAAKPIEMRMVECLLRVARFRGNDKSEFIDNRQFYGNIFALLQHAERFLMDTLPIAGRVTPGKMEREDFPLYPQVALRETLANAFCHRDYATIGGSVGVAVYDNRLEITSTGPLHFGLTPEDLYVPHASHPWNPLIARTLHRRGVIETWGRGTLKVMESLASAGLPRQTITELTGCVMVTFTPSENLLARQATPEVTAQATAQDNTLLNKWLSDLAIALTLPAAQATAQAAAQVEKILRAAGEPVDRDLLQRAANLNHREHFRKAYLEPLVSSGWLEQSIPDKPTSPNQRYRLTEKGRAWLEKTGK